MDRRSRSREHDAEVARYRHRRRRPFRLLTVALSLLIGGVAVELALRLRAEKSGRAVWATLASRSTVPFSEPGAESWAIADQVLGYRLNPAHPDISSLGIRHPEMGRNSPDRVRILVLGDSVAWPTGGFVDQFAESLGPRAEVINAAVPGYTTHQERRFFEDSLQALSPDLVILQYCLNDNHRFLHRFDADTRMLFTEEARRALLGEEGLWSRLSRRSYLVLRLRFAWLSWRTQRGEYPWSRQIDFGIAWRSPGWARFEEELMALRAAVDDEGGGRLTVLMAPYGPQFRPHLLQRDRAHVLLPQDRMAAICRRLNVPLLDLYPRFAEAGGESLFEDGVHFTDRGHQVATEALLGHLEEHQLVALDYESATGYSLRRQPR